MSNLIHTCSNCEKECSGESVALELTAPDGPDNREVVAAICQNCVTDVAVLKIVVKRLSKDKDFAFEQLLPVETLKG